jgi:D-arabinose 5-phosphate isomerase GutQ
MAKSCPSRFLTAAACSSQSAQEQQVPMISLISTKGSTLEKLSTTTLFAKGTTRYHFLYPLTSFSMVLHKITAAALPLHTLIKPYRTNK